MPIRIEFPLTKTFGLVTYMEEGRRRLRRARDGEDPEGFVTFRQASISEAEERTGISSKRKYSGTSEETFTVVDDLNLDLLARMEVFLTLSGTDIEYPDGKDESGEVKWLSLEFVEPQGFKKVKSQNQFNKWFKSMDPQWGRVIHECCLEVNPDWNLKS